MLRKFRSIPAKNETVKRAPHNKGHAQQGHSRRRTMCTISGECTVCARCVRSAERAQYIIQDMPRSHTMCRTAGVCKRVQYGKTNCSQHKAA
eukprot:7650001-Pyramimonas_sp.AAC.1